MTIDTTSGPVTAPTVLDALQASPVAPVLDMPLPPAPALPTVDLPAAPDPAAIGELLQSIPVPTLPEIDELVRPIAELGNMFGTGICEALDPSAILQQGSRLIDGAALLGRSALDALPDSWQSDAAEASADHVRRAQVAAVELSERGDNIGAVTRAATATVERGNIELTGIAQSFIASAIASAPVALTPPGQAALLASAAEHLSSALAVVARTRGELSGHTIAMNTLTAPIPVPAPVATSMPIDPTSLAGPVTDVAGGIGDAFSGSGGSASLPAPTQATSYGAAPTVATSALPGGTVGTAGFGGIAGGYTTVAGGTASGAGILPGTAPVPMTAATGSGTTAASSAAAGAARHPIVGGAPIGSAARGSDDDRRGIPDFLVTSGTQSEIVGDLPFVTPAVIGAVDDDR